MRRTNEAVQQESDQEFPKLIKEIIKNFDFSNCTMITTKPNSLARSCRDLQIPDHQFHNKSQKH